MVNYGELGTPQKWRYWLFLAVVGWMFMIYQKNIGQFLCPMAWNFTETQTERILKSTLWWTYKKQWKMAIYSGFAHEKWWFSIAMLVHQRVLGLKASASWNRISQDQPRIRWDPRRGVGRRRRFPGGNTGTFGGWIKIHKASNVDACQVGPSILKKATVATPKKDIL